MVTRVHLVDGEYRIVLSDAAMAELGLKDGDQVTVRAVCPACDTGHSTMSLEEGMAAFHAFEAEHHQTFLELAK